MREPAFKRPFDLLLAAVGLALTWPLWAAAGMAIWLEDGRPVFFRQPRIGRCGKPVRILKFRSMVRDASTEVQATRNDPRITRVGRVLRRTSLDELPQLWNILVGDMSFVGPRAQPHKEIVRAGGVMKELSIPELPAFTRRQMVLPGLTGVAQLFAPREVPHRQKFRYDLIYVRRLRDHAVLSERVARERGWFGRIVGGALVFRSNLSLLWLDVRLIVRSVWVTFLGQWEV
jgi:lipopolysaccharide/colanic/teichoic acid biosynthesis glycosyltransferase